MALLRDVTIILQKEPRSSKLLQHSPSVATRLKGKILGLEGSGGKGLGMMVESLDKMSVLPEIHKPRGNMLRRVG